MPRYPMTASAAARRLACVTVTPLGRPVEPDVKTICAGSMPIWGTGARQRRADGRRPTLEGGIVSAAPPLDHCGERTPSTRRLPQQVGDIGDQKYLQHTRTASAVPRQARVFVYIWVLRRRTT